MKCNKQALSAILLMLTLPVGCEPEEIGVPDTVEQQVVPETHAAPLAQEAATIEPRLDALPAPLAENLVRTADDPGAPQAEPVVSVGPIQDPTGVVTGLAQSSPAVVGLESQDPHLPEPGQAAKSGVLVGGPVDESDRYEPEVLDEDSPMNPIFTETDGVMLSQLVLARGIESRKPVEPGTTFDRGITERVYVFMWVSNPAKTETEVTVSWVPEEGGKEWGTINVTIGPFEQWRTWAFTRLGRKVGKWEVIVRDSEGIVIARAPFEVVE